MSSKELGVGEYTKWASSCQEDLTQIPGPYKWFYYKGLRRFRRLRRRSPVRR